MLSDRVQLLDIDHWHHHKSFFLDKLGVLAVLGGRVDLLDRLLPLRVHDLHLAGTLVGAHLTTPILGTHPLLQR